ncbi:MAG: hypothetical protein ACOC24_02775 [Desulfovibrionales bacterium]
MRRLTVLCILALLAATASSETLRGPQAGELLVSPTEGAERGGIGLESIVLVQIAGDDRFLEAIDRPTLLVNALNDPFLSPSCFPLAQAAASPYLHLECPRSGGHVGFLGLDRKGVSWAEKRTVQFLTSGT